LEQIIFEIDFIIVVVEIELIVICDHDELIQIFDVMIMILIIMEVLYYENNKDIENIHFNL
jgi:hypothetical protein